MLEKKEDTKKIREDDSASANQGSEENVSKEEDIMKEEGSRVPDSNANSKENIVGGKRGHSTDSSSSNLAIKKSKHGSGDKIVTPDVKGTAKDSKSNEVSKDGLNYDVIFGSLSRNFPVSHLQTKLNDQSSLRTAKRTLASHCLASYWIRVYFNPSLRKKLSSQDRQQQQWETTSSIQPIPLVSL